MLVSVLKMVISSANPFIFPFLYRNMPSSQYAMHKPPSAYCSCGLAMRALVEIWCPTNTCNPSLLSSSKTRYKGIAFLQRVPHKVFRNLWNSQLLLLSFTFPLETSPLLFSSTKALGSGLKGRKSGFWKWCEFMNEICENGVLHHFIQ